MRIHVVFIYVIHIYFCFLFKSMSSFQSLSQKTGLAEKQNPTKTLFVLGIVLKPFPTSNFLAKFVCGNQFWVVVTILGRILSDRCIVAWPQNQNHHASGGEQGGEWYVICLMLAGPPNESTNPSISESSNNNNNNNNHNSNILK